nr:hypothetical protein [Burkholderia gladioli]
MLLPLKPKLLTPASQGRPSAGRSGVGCRTTSNFAASQPIAGFSVSKPGCGGASPWRSTSIALISPASPEAASVWPMKDFSAPSTGGGGARRLAGIDGAQRVVFDRIPSAVPVL